MKIYEGKRVNGSPVVSVFDRENNREYERRVLNPTHSQNIVNHSPDGFEWGYGGSGPSQLALAILCDCVGDEIAQRYYHTFKWEFLAKAPAHGFQISESYINLWLGPLLHACV